MESTETSPKEVHVKARHFAFRQARLWSLKTDVMVVRTLSRHDAFRPCRRSSGITYYCNFTVTFWPQNHSEVRLLLRTAISNA